MRHIILFLLIMALTVSSVFSQYTLSRSNFNAAGGSVSAGNYTLLSNFGHPIEGSEVTAGNYTLGSGFIRTLPGLPTLTTTAITNILETSASSGGNITDDGGSPVTASGIVYATTSNPIIGGPGVTQVVTNPLVETGAFTSALSGLSINTRYYIRAYATNTSGTSYGDEVNFYTLAEVPSAPTVNNAAATTLDVAINANGNPVGTEYAIRVGGNYVQANGSIAGGEVWQTEAAWEVDNGSTAKTITGLSPNVQYTFEVKARNGNGTPDESAYSSTTSLYTLANVPATMTYVDNTTTSIDLQINANSNPAGTQYAIYNGSQYLQTDGSTFTGTEAWQTEAQWESTGGNLRISGLTSGNAYNWQAKARNGDDVETALSTALATKTLPTQATNVAFSNITANTFDIGWTRGNGDGVVVFLKESDTGTATPVDGTTYTANTTFTSGTQIGTTGWFCVYSGTGTSASISNVNTSNQYIAQAFEYVNFTDNNFTFNTATATGNPAGACQPTVYVDASYTVENETQFNSLANALSNVCPGGTVYLSQLSETSYEGNVTFTGLTVIIPAQYDFNLNGDLTFVGGGVQTPDEGRLNLPAETDGSTTYPFSDGTNTYSVNIDPSTPSNIDVKITPKADLPSNKQASNMLSNTVFEIEGADNLDATIVFTIPDASIQGGTLPENVIFRYWDADENRYKAIDANKVTIVDQGTYYTVTITNVNKF